MSLRAQIDNKIQAVVKDLTLNRIKIYGRHHQIIAILLTLFSPLEILFEGKKLRGWLDTLIFGESQSGKSISAIQLIMSIIKRGGYINGENMTNVGLQGGIDKVGGENMIAPGLFSICDGEIVVIDELQGMHYEEFSRLSDVRMRGIASIQKVKSFSAPARCRKIWTANPRPPGPTVTVKFNSELHPINLVRKLIVTYEDLTRFDLIVGYKESPLELNSQSSECIEHIYTDEILSKAVEKAWNRKLVNVVFPKETSNACYEYSKQMVAQYKTDFPMVLGAGQPDRLARLAAACANMIPIYGDTSIDNLKQLVVKPDHVEWVVCWLNELFKSDDLNYALYAKMYRGREEAAKANKQELLAIIRGIKNYANLLYVCANSTYISSQKLREYSCQHDNLDAVISGFFRAGLLRQSKNGFVKSDFFNELLKEEFFEEINRFDIKDINFGEVGF